MTGDKYVLVTGGARRIGRSISVAIAKAGLNVAIHYWQSQEDAENLRIEIEKLGRKALLLQADLSDSEQVTGLIPRILEQGILVGLINNASIFEKGDWQNTDIKKWNRNIMINLTSPFLLSQAFAYSLPLGEQGRIINMLDWRVSRPDSKHLPYSISKSGLAALTQSLAVSLAPQITVNGLALGAVLPPIDGSETQTTVDKVPSGRWANLEEITQAVLFLLKGPTYITGEILYIDGGRHLL